MKVVILEQFGGVENLLTKEIETPYIAEGEVLIKTKAIGINPVDIKTRQGHGAAKRLELPIILGWDVSGVVVQVTKNSAFKVGDAVFGLVNFPGEGKTYAEYVVAPEEHITLKPDNVSFSEAAAVPLASLIAYQALIKTANIQSGNKVLIQGAAGGVGHLAVQIAKNAGAYVIGTAQLSDEQLLTSLGIDECIDYTKERFEEKVHSVDVALDCVGGEITVKTMNVVKDGGILISIPAPVDEKLAREHLTVKVPWVLVQSSKHDIEHIADLVESGKLKVHIYKTFPFDKIGEAHRQLEHGHTVGKVVVTL